MQDKLTLFKKLESLRIQHKQLDEKINHFHTVANADELRIMRMKREKLALKDQIIQIENILHPDIIA
jgi:hypothetical protein